MSAIDVNTLWDYGKPDVSEARFREAARTATGDDAAILQTQIARTYGLRRRFDEARSILREVEPLLATLSPEARTRYQLELGRTLVSPVHRDPERTPQARADAKAAYMKAFEIARDNALDSLAIDALHMLAVVETEEAANLKWTEQALAYMLQSKQPDAHKWEVSLRNNVGYSLHKLGRLDEALAIFQSNIAPTERGGNVGRLRIAHWMVAWTLRGLGRIDDALAIQLRLERENAADGKPDEYVFEELVHLYKAKGDAEKEKHYANLHARHKAP